MFTKTTNKFNEVYLEEIKRAKVLTEKINNLKVLDQDIFNELFIVDISEEEILLDLDKQFSRNPHKWPHWDQA